MERRQSRRSRRKVDYHLLEDSDSDNDFTPVVKKRKKEAVSPVKPDSSSVSLSTTKRLSRDEKLFQRQMKAAVNASLSTATEAIVIANPMIESDKENDEQSGEEQCAAGGDSGEANVDPPQKGTVEPCDREEERQEHIEGTIQTSTELSCKQPAAPVTKPPRGRKWNPPATANSHGMSRSVRQPTGSPSIRVGLSRNAKIKPLHTLAK